MTAESEWVDPRLTVFLIWGVCVTIFLCYPSKDIILGFCHRIGLPCCANYVAPQRELPSSDNEIDYECLSDEKKHEIDSLRSIALLHYLSHFSMTIRSEDMLRRKSLSKLHFNESQVSITSDPQCREEEEIHTLEGIIPVPVPDVENVLATTLQDEVVDIPLNDDEELVDTGQSSEVDDGYTHVKIPCPGHGIGLSPLKSKVLNKHCGKHKNRRGIFVRNKAKDKQEQDQHACNIISDEQKNAEKRDVPLHCAICLMKYNVSERVCWASNPECTHVFHEDCIVNWLIYRGRAKSKLQRYPEHNRYTDAQLLNYKLECPCCRQEFVWKEAVDENERV